MKKKGPMSRGLYVTWVWAVACLVFLHLKIIKEQTSLNYY